MSPGAGSGGAEAGRKAGKLRRGAGRHRVESWTWASDRPEAVTGFARFGQSPQGAQYRWVVDGISRWVAEPSHTVSGWDVLPPGTHRAELEVWLPRDGEWWGGCFQASCDALKVNGQTALWSTPLPGAEKAVVRRRPLPVRAVATRGSRRVGVW